MWQHEKKTKNKKKRQAIGAINLQGIKPTTITGTLTKRCDYMLIPVITILRRIYDQAPKKRVTGRSTVTEN